MCYVGRACLGVQIRKARSHLRLRAFRIFYLLLFYDADALKALVLAGPLGNESLSFAHGHRVGGSVTRSEDIGIIRVAYECKVGEVCALAILVVTVHVAVVHKDPLVRVDELKYC